MATESQLEIYRIVLGKRTFKEIVREKNNIPTEEERTDENLFTLLFQNILSKLTQNAAWTSDRTKLGLALFSNDGEDVNRILSNHSGHFVIEGYIDGGYYDKLRTIAQTNNVATRERLGRDKMVTDRYYIYLYCPIDAKVGIMFLEKKKGLNIHTAVDLFITEVFKTPRYAVKIERFVPQSIINEYKDEGVVDSFTFTDAITTSVIDGQGIELEEKRYGVTIKITLPEDERPEFDVVQQMLQWLGNGAISLGNSVMHLSEFGKKKGSLQKEEKKYSFEVGDDLKIKPMIPIDDELQDEDNSILRRNEIKTMCDEVLAQIREEVYPAN
ncbi:MAG: hypothetical protein J5965_26045 [Aeriscardovia sp.]|nr:hypothetical protein [Aeriscardovia sp.]